MAAVHLSSVESCEGGHGLCHHLLEKSRSAVFSPKNDRVMAMVIFFLSLVESCPPLPQWPGSMTREWQLLGPCKLWPSLSRLLRNLQAGGGSWSWRASRLLLIGRARLALLVNFFPS